MKIAKAGTVNYLSFIRTSDLTVDSFSLQLTAVVGGQSYSFTSLQDLHHLADCRDFFVLTLDLMSTQVSGGEYELTLYNNSEQRGKYLITVIGYQYDAVGTGIYDNVVSVTDL